MYRGIRTASRGAGTKFLVRCKDAIQGMHCYIIIRIVSVSNNLLMVTIKFASLYCVCQPCYAVGPPQQRVDCFALRLKEKKLNVLSEILEKAHTTVQPISML